MNLEFKKPQSDKEWDKYVVKLENYSFLLSSARFQYLKESSDTFRYLLFDQNDFVGILQGSFGELRIFGKYLECKHNPTLVKGLNDNRKADILRAVLQKLKELAKENRCFFIRLSPIIQKDDIFLKIYDEFNAIEAPIHNRDALITQHIDTTKSLEELHSDMNKSSRSKVNQLKEDKDTKVEFVEDMSMFQTFKNFYLQTKEFKGFTGKGIETLKKELQYQADNNMLYFVTVYTKNEPVTVWQLTKFGKYMHLYQAASDLKFEEKKARLVFWHVLKLCKELDVKILDLFGGMLPEGIQGNGHPWKGINYFKGSLGGEKVTYMHHRDISLNPLYYIYSIYSKYQEARKGYTTDW
jgi:hypothetical protein